MAAPERARGIGRAPGFSSFARENRGAVSGNGSGRGSGGGQRRAAPRPRRGRDLPLPLLLPLAVGAVIGERLGRRGLAILAPVALLALILGILGLGRPQTRLAGEREEAATTLTAPIAAAAPAIEVVAVAPPTATLPDPTIPANAGGERVPTAAASAPTVAPPPVAPPTVPPTAGATAPTVALQPLVPAATAAPPTPKPRRHDDHPDPDVPLRARRHRPARIRSASACR